MDYADNSDSRSNNGTLPPGFPTALQVCQKQRDEIRAERDAATAEVARLRAALDVEAWPILTIEQVNTLVAGDVWWPCGANDAIVKTLKASLHEQRRRYAARVDSILNPTA